MEIQYPDFKAKSKWHTPAAAAGATAVLATAIVFVLIHWSPADGFAKSLINPVTKSVLTQPRSDLSEQDVNAGSDMNNIVTEPGGNAVTEPELPPDINGDNANAVAGGTDDTQNPQNPDSSSEFFDEHSVTPGEVTGITLPPDGDTTGGTSNGGSNPVVGLPSAPNVVLTQETVRFKPDSSEFVDPLEAEAVISKYANNLRGLDLDIKVYVIGTAADTWGDTQRLSEQRALTVLQTLIKLGVPEKSICAFGMSNQDPWHMKNMDENGAWLADIAKVNRKVVLILSGDEAAQAVANQIIENNKTLTMFRYEGGELITERFDKLD